MDPCIRVSKASGYFFLSPRSKSWLKRDNPSGQLADTQWNPSDVLMLRNKDHNTLKPPR